MESQKRVVGRLLQLKGQAATTVKAAFRIIDGTPVSVTTVGGKVITL